MGAATVVPAERMRGMYEYGRSRLAARAGETDDGDGY
jgi:hypothetical protein